MCCSVCFRKHTADYCVTVELYSSSFHKLTLARMSLCTFNHLLISENLIPDSSQTALFSFYPSDVLKITEKIKWLAKKKN